MSDTFEIVLQDKKYRGKKLNISDFAAFEDFVRDRRGKRLIKTAKELYGDKIPDSIFEKAIKLPSPDELELEQQSLAGVSFLFFRSLKKCDDAITMEDISELITLDNVPELMALVVPDVLEDIKKKKSKAPKKSIVPGK